MQSAVLRWSMVGILLLALILVPFVLWEEGFDAFAARLLDQDNAPVIALVVIALLAADIFLPVPSSLVAVSAGALLGWQVGTVTVWIGLTLGCLAGYWTGAWGGAPVVSRFMGADELERANRLAERIGFGTLVVARAVPVLAEGSVLAAGLVRYPFRGFFIITALANLGVAALYCFVGAASLETSSFLLAFAGAIIVPVAGFLIWKLVMRARPAG